MQTSDLQPSQRLSGKFTNVPSKVSELMQKQFAEQVTQRRSGAEGKGVDEKFRVTLSGVSPGDPGISRRF